ncbi:hypothetical protein SASPL_153499 [Salvia splendens]|uniref:Uncharacterized protein n=1 Tax=Salvia splendens TaxID=180675 RepID=A0A8X8W4X8_SALSN|nr:hypothetical protein SASPL_153499 [Salvia splendens]
MRDVEFPKPAHRRQREIAANLFHESVLLRHYLVSQCCVCLAAHVMGELLHLHQIGDPLRRVALLPQLRYSGAGIQHDGAEEVEAGPRLATVAGAKDLTEEKRGRGSVDLDLDMGSAEVDGLNLNLDGEMLAAAVMVVSFSYAALHVQQKRQKERLLKKKEQLKKLSVEKHVVEASDCKAATICSAKAKIHPAPLFI